MTQFKRNPKLYLDTVKEILHHGKSVPKLPPLVTQFQQNLDSLDYRQLDEAFQKDPSLTAVILKTANGALYKRPVPVNSVKDGIATLGMNTVQSLVVAHQLQSLFSTQDKKLTEHLKNRWARTQRFAACCKKLADLMDMDGNLAYLSAMLSDLGSALIAQEFPRFQRKEDPNLFNWVADHYSHLISAHMLKSWHFDEQVWMPIKKKGQWQYKSDLAMGLPEVLNFCWIHLLDDESTPELDELPRFFNIPASIRILASPRQFFLLKDY